MRKRQIRAISSNRKVRNTYCICPDFYYLLACRNFHTENNSITSKISRRDNAKVSKGLGLVRIFVSP